MEIDEMKNKLPQFTNHRLLMEIAKEGIQANFEPGKLILEPGKYIHTIPIVLKGAIKVIRMDEEGKELFLYYIGPGQTCALSLTCCSVSRPSEVKVVAEEFTTILAIPLGLHEKWMHEFREWKEFVSLTYLQRFQEMLNVLDAVAFQRMDERLMRYLVTKMKQQKSNELNATHQVIANELGTSREVISRLLKQLEKKKWVELGRNVIYIHDDFEELTRK